VIRFSLTGIAGAARDGLLAMSVAAGLAVMQAMFDAEIDEIAGPKGKHNPRVPRCGTALVAAR
jgi:putative transposase